MPGKSHPIDPIQRRGCEGKKKKKKRKKILQPFSCVFIFFLSSLRKNPAERMNYLELMVSAELFLLALVPLLKHFGIKGPSKMEQQGVGGGDFQAHGGVGVAWLKWKAVLNSGVLRSVSKCFLPLSYLLSVALGKQPQKLVAWVGLNPEMPNLEALSFELRDGAHGSLGRTLVSPWPFV